MSNWTAGYIAEINYTHGFYREQAPSIHALVGLLSRKRGPDPSAQLAYCELGCGQGLTVNILAAANPQTDFYANDFNPAQIASARGLAAESALTNVHFSDASFLEYVDDPTLPQFDIIALHGIYSWVSPENRASIVEFVRRKLKVGGYVYISYNTLPGWSAAAPIRRLLSDHATTTGGPLLTRIDKALIFAERMAEADGAFFRDVNGIKPRLEKIKTMNRNYVAHEYFNKSWFPLYSADVAQELDHAKLTYLGSAHILDHVNAVNFTDKHLAIFNEIGDPTFRETVRDFLTLQQFRRDIFVRGAVPLNDTEVHEGWLALRLALTTPRADAPMKVTGPLGEVGLQEDTYKPLYDALADGPRTVAQLIENPIIRDFGWQRLREAVQIVLGSGSVSLCLPAKGEAQRAQRTRAFNTAIMRHAIFSMDLAFLASPVLGGGVMVERFHQLFLLGMQEKAADPAQFAWDLLAQTNQKLVKDGKPIERAEDNLSELRSRYAVFKEKYLAVYKQLGLY